MAQRDFGDDSGPVARGLWALVVCCVILVAGVLILRDLGYDVDVPKALASKEDTGQAEITLDSSVEPPQHCVNEYTVQTDKTLYQEALNHNWNLWGVLEVNPQFTELWELDNLIPGQKICVPWEVDAENE